MRERMAEEDVLMTRRQEAGHDQRVKEAFYKFQQDVAQMEPISRLTTLEQFVQDPEAQRQFKGQKEAAMMEMLPVWTKVSKGEQLDNNDLMALQKYIPTDKIQTTINEWGQNIRFFKELPIKQGELGVRQGELGVRQREVSLKEKESPKGSVVKEKITAITDAINFLEPVARGDNANVIAYKEPAGYMIRQLQSIQNKALNGEPLTKEDDRTINESRDLYSMVKKYGKGELTGQQNYSIYDKTSLEEETNRSLSARPIMPDAVKKEFAPQEISLGGNVGQVLGKAPAPAGQSAHAIGERKPKTFDNGSQALYEWDGSRWIFVKAL